MKIMTGKAGTPHVTSQQFRQFVEAVAGQDSYILQSGENLEPELQTNNLLKIRSGIMSHHGNLSVVDIGTYDEVTIANGTQGMQRIDLVVNRYTRDEPSGVESNTWVVIQGTPNASNPVAPAYTEGNLQEGDLVDDCPVFEVHLNGINVTEVVKLLDVVPNISELNGNLPLIQSGSTGYINVPANSYKDVQIEFPKPFESDPNISASIWGMSDSPSYGNINFSYDNISKTGFTMRIYNDNTSARVPRFRWIAIAG